MNKQTLGIAMLVYFVVLVLGPMGIIGSAVAVAAIGGTAYAAGRSSKELGSSRPATSITSRRLRKAIKNRL